MTATTTFAQKTVASLFALVISFVALSAAAGPLVA